MTFISLQALRGVAALGVVLFHLLPFEAKYLPGATIVPSGFSAGRAGVDLFFVLSGFLAVWTTLGPAGAGAAQRFLLRRVTRIYPTYWIYCIPLIAAGLGAPGGLFGAGRRIWRLRCCSSRTPRRPCCWWRGRSSSRSISTWSLPF